MLGIRLVQAGSRKDLASPDTSTSPLGRSSGSEFTKSMVFDHFIPFRPVTLSAHYLVVLWCRQGGVLLLAGDLVAVVRQ